MCLWLVHPWSASENPPLRFPRWPRTWLRLFPAPRRFLSPFDRLRKASPSCKHGRTIPRNAKLVQPSPWRIDSFSGPANWWALLSFRPCLPIVRVAANSRAPSLHRHYSASPLLRTPPPPSRRSPISRFRRLYGSLLRRFRDGTRRASPVA